MTAGAGDLLGRIRLAPTSWSTHFIPALTSDISGAASGRFTSDRSASLCPLRVVTVEVNVGCLIATWRAGGVLEGALSDGDRRRLGKVRAAKVCL